MDNQGNNVGILQQLIGYIKKVFDGTKGLFGSALDKELINSARNEEAEIIKEMCANVDLYYQKRDEFRKSGLKPGKWLEKEVENTVKDVYPEADEEDLDEVKTEVSKTLENEIKALTDLVEEEMTPVTEEIDKNV